MGDKASRLRQRLNEVAEQQQLELEIICGERGALIRGSFGTRSRVCGTPTCHCATGERHESKYLTATDNGKVRQVHVPASDEAAVGAGVQRYRRFWRARARLAKLNQQQLGLVDELGRSLLEPYPPDRPLPAASHVGRPPRRSGARR
jgi:hypothetical protein